MCIPRCSCLGETVSGEAGPGVRSRAARACHALRTTARPNRRHGDLAAATPRPPC